jgi:glycosyltransferase involved in cell wall biosynthesis
MDKMAEMKPAERDSSEVRITALICALNEEANLSQVLPKIPDCVNEVLLVDGHSSDNTVEVARNLRPDIRILYQPGKGKGDALKHGIKHASGDIIVMLDADGATDPEEMRKFIEPLLDGYEFAKGSRFLGRFPNGKRWYRVLGNWFITVTFNILFFKKYTDLCSGYNAFWRKAIEGVNLWSPDGFENEPLINTRITKKKVKVIEVGHSDKGRLNGEIKELTWRQGFKAIKTLIRERFRD